MRDRIFAALLVACAAHAEVPKAQTVTLGDTHVQSHLPVALVTGPDTQQRLVQAFVALASGAESVPAEPASTGIAVEVVWCPATPAERVLPLAAGAVLLPIPPHASGSYPYYIRIRDAH